MTTETTSTTIDEMTSITATNTLTATNTIAVAPNRLTVLDRTDMNEWSWRRGMLATVDQATTIAINEDSVERAAGLRPENRDRAMADDQTVIVNDSIQTVHMGRDRPQMTDRMADAETKEPDQEQAEMDINAGSLMDHVITTGSADVAVGQDLTTVIRIGTGQDVDTSTRNTAMTVSTATIDGITAITLMVAISTDDIISDIDITVNSADIDLRDMATIVSTATIDGITAIILMVTISRDDTTLDIDITENLADIDTRDMATVDSTATINGITAITLMVAASRDDIISDQTHGNLLIAPVVIGSQEDTVTADGTDHRLIAWISTVMERSRKTKSFSCTPRSTRTAMAQ